MRVVVLGGYGVFGSRIAALLVRDGVEVWIAGRRPSQIHAEVKRLGSLARPLEVNLEGDLRPIFAPAPDIVIDAAGPFGTYATRRDQYAVPRACLRHGCDYIDLSDDAKHVAGIGVLNADAKAVDRRLLSGASSVPGLSSIVVNALSQGMSEIISIESAILPGNRAPRGTSVIAGIVRQLGMVIPVWRGNVWQETPVWGDAKAIRLAPDLIRKGRVIGVPDLALFPSAFQARSVTFRAGMEIWPLDQGMRIIAAIRKRIPFGITVRRAGWLRWIASSLEGFGSDRGGMRVAVLGRKEEENETELREWCLVAEAGEGPFIPGVVCRAIVRRLARERSGISPGARPCIAEVSLEEIDDALSDLKVTTTQRRQPSPSLFRSVIGVEWDLLPAKVRSSHDVHDIESFSGIARVETGASIVARFVRVVFDFPGASDRVDVHVTKIRSVASNAPCERWERSFGNHRFRSHIRPAGRPGHIRERFGAMEFELRLEAGRSGIGWHVARGWCLGLPIPKWLLPVSHTWEYVSEGRFNFDVGLQAPLGLGLIVRYVGCLKHERDAAT